MESIATDNCTADAHNIINYDTHNYRFEVGREADATGAFDRTAEEAGVQIKDTNAALLPSMPVANSAIVGKISVSPNSISPKKNMASAPSAIVSHQRTAVTLGIPSLLVQQQEAAMDYLDRREEKLLRSQLGVSSKSLGVGAAGPPITLDVGDTNTTLTSTSSGNTSDACDAPPPLILGGPAVNDILTIRNSNMQLLKHDKRQYHQDPFAAVVVGSSEGLEGRGSISAALQREGATSGAAATDAVIGVSNKNMCCNGKIVKMPADNNNNNSANGTTTSADNSTEPGMTQCTPPEGASLAVGVARFADNSNYPHHASDTNSLTHSGDQNHVGRRMTSSPQPALPAVTVDQSHKNTIAVYNNHHDNRHHYDSGDGVFLSNGRRGGERLSAVDARKGAGLMGGGEGVGPLQTASAGFVDHAAEYYYTSSNPNKRGGLRSGSSSSTTSHMNQGTRSKLGRRRSAHSRRSNAMGKVAGKDARIDTQMDGANKRKVPSSSSLSPSSFPFSSFLCCSPINLMDWRKDGNSFFGAFKQTLAIQSRSIPNVMAALMVLAVLLTAAGVILPIEFITRDGRLRAERLTNVGDADFVGTGSPIRRFYPNDEDTPTTSPSSSMDFFSHSNAGQYQYNSILYSGTYIPTAGPNETFLAVFGEEASSASSRNAGKINPFLTHLATLPVTLKEAIEATLIDGPLKDAERLMTRVASDRRAPVWEEERGRRAHARRVIKALASEASPLVLLGSSLPSFDYKAVDAATWNLSANLLTSAGRLPQYCWAVETRRRLHLSEWFKQTHARYQRQREELAAAAGGLFATANTSRNASFLDFIEEDLPLLQESYYFSEGASLLSHLRVLTDAPPSLSKFYGDVLACEPMPMLSSEENTQSSVDTRSTTGSSGVSMMSSNPMRNVSVILAGNASQFENDLSAPFPFVVNSEDISNLQAETGADDRATLGYNQQQTPWRSYYRSLLFDTFKASSTLYRSVMIAFESGDEVEGDDAGEDSSDSYHFLGVGVADGGKKQSVRRFDFGESKRSAHSSNTLVFEKVEAFEGMRLSSRDAAFYTAVSSVKGGGGGGGDTLPLLHDEVAGQKAEGDADGAFNYSTYLTSRTEIDARNGMSTHLPQFALIRRSVRNSRIAAGVGKKKMVRRRFGRQWMADAKTMSQGQKLWTLYNSTPDSIDDTMRAVRVTTPASPAFVRIEELAFPEMILTFPLFNHQSTFLGMGAIAVDIARLADLLVKSLPLKMGGIAMIATGRMANVILASSTAGGPPVTGEAANPTNSKPDTLVDGSVRFNIRRNATDFIGRHPSAPLPDDMLAPALGGSDRFGFSTRLMSADEYSERACRNYDLRGYPDEIYGIGRVCFHRVETLGYRPLVSFHSHMLASLKVKPSDEGNHRTNLTTNSSSSYRHDDVYAFVYHHRHIEKNPDAIAFRSVLGSSAMSPPAFTTASSWFLNLYCQLQWTTAPLSTRFGFNCLAQQQEAAPPILASWAPLDGIGDIDARPASQTVRADDAVRSGLSSFGGVKGYKPPTAQQANSDTITTLAAAENYSLPFQKTPPLTVPSSAAATPFAAGQWFLYCFFPIPTQSAGESNSKSDLHNVLEELKTARTLALVIATVIALFIAIVFCVLVRRLLSPIARIAKIMTIAAFVLDDDDLNETEEEEEGDSFDGDVADNNRLGGVGIVKKSVRAKEEGRGAEDSSSTSSIERDSPRRSRSFSSLDSVDDEDRPRRDVQPSSKPSSPTKLAATFPQQKAAAVGGVGGGGEEDSDGPARMLAERVRRRKERRVKQRALLRDRTTSGWLEVGAIQHACWSMREEMQALKVYVPEHLKREVAWLRAQRELERERGGGKGSAKATPWKGKEEGAGEGLVANGQADEKRRANGDANSDDDSNEDDSSAESEESLGAKQRRTLDPLASLRKAHAATEGDQQALLSDPNAAFNAPQQQHQQQDWFATTAFPLPPRPPARPSAECPIHGDHAKAVGEGAKGALRGLLNSAGNARRWNSTPQHTSKARRSPYVAIYSHATSSDSMEEDDADASRIQFRTVCTCTHASDKGGMVPVGGNLPAVGGEGIEMRVIAVTNKNNNNLQNTLVGAKGPSMAHAANTCNTLRKNRATSRASSRRYGASTWGGRRAGESEGEGGEGAMLDGYPRSLLPASSVAARSNAFDGVPTGTVDDASMAAARREAAPLPTTNHIFFADNCLVDRDIAVAHLNIIHFHFYARSHSGVTLSDHFSEFIHFVHKQARRFGGILESFSGDKVWVSFNATSKREDCAIAAAYFAFHVTNTINNATIAHALNRKKKMAAQRARRQALKDEKDRAARGGEVDGGDADNNNRQNTPTETNHSDADTDDTMVGGSPRVYQKDPNEAPYFKICSEGVSAGVAIGRAFVGPMGTSVIKRHSILSNAITEAAALERQALRYPGCSALVSGRMLPQIEGYCQYILVDATLLPGNDDKRRRIACLKGPMVAEGYSQEKVMGWLPMAMVGESRRDAKLRRKAQRKYGALVSAAIAAAASTGEPLVLPPSPPLPYAPISLAIPTVNSYKTINEAFNAFLEGNPVVCARLVTAVREEVAALERWIADRERLQTNATMTASMIGSSPQPISSCSALATLSSGGANGRNAHPSLTLASSSSVLLPTETLDDAIERKAITTVMAQLLEGLLASNADGATYRSALGESHAYFVHVLSISKGK